MPPALPVAKSGRIASALGMNAGGRASNRNQGLSGLTEAPHPAQRYRSPVGRVQRGFSGPRGFSERRKRT